MNVTRGWTFLQPFLDLDFAPFFEGKGFARGSSAAHVVKDYTNKAKTDMFLPLSES